MKVLRLFTDGAARGNPGPAGLGMVIEDDQGMRLWGGCSYVGTATNNRAEYLALITGLRKASEWRPDRLEVYLDSKLVVEQVSGRWKVRHADLEPLHRQADPVAQVVGGQCQACRVQVTSSGMQTLRRAGLVHCDNCGRILVVA